MKDTYDVVIVGAGINGLACGAYLAKAGLEVAVAEKRNECGPFALTEDIFGAGVPVDTHASICLIPMSPVWGDLDLGGFGFKVFVPEVLMATMWPDRNLVSYGGDWKKTVDAIARHSQKDAKTFLHIGEQLWPHRTEILERAVFSPASPEGEDYLFSLGKLIGFSPEDFRTMNGMELVELLFENEFVRLSNLSVGVGNAFGDPPERGEGAITVLLDWMSSSGVPVGGMHTLVHALVRCFRAHGGTLLLNAPVEKVTWQGDKPTGVVLSEDSPFGPRELKARHAVVMHTTPPVALPLLGAEHVARLDGDLAHKMKTWDMTGHCAFLSYFLLKGAPQWRSASWNPDVLKCPYPYHTWRSWDHAVRSFQYARNDDLFAIVEDAGDANEIFTPAIADPSRLGPHGECVVTYEVEYPVSLRRYGGPGAWDNRELTDRIHARHLAELEELAQGFKENLIASTYTTPLDNWRRNPSAIYGHELGGNVSGLQWYLGRMPARSRIPGLYFSQSIWPVSLTHLGNGYVTAGSVAEDLGVRKQEWWSCRPLEPRTVARS